MSIFNDLKNHLLNSKIETTEEKQDDVFLKNHCYNHKKRVIRFVLANCYSYQTKITKKKHEFMNIEYCKKLRIPNGIRLKEALEMISFLASEGKVMFGLDIDNYSMLKSIESQLIMFGFKEIEEMVEDVESLDLYVVSGDKQIFKDNKEHYSKYFDFSMIGVTRKRFENILMKIDDNQSAM